jgi:hypothetical protein
MKTLLCLIMLVFTLPAWSQHTGDSVYQRCPVSIYDTLTGNNYFIIAQKATVHTYHDRGNFTISIEQKGQFLTLMFNEKKLSTKGKYDIGVDVGGKHNVSVKYSFRSGTEVAYLDVSSGTITSAYDKTTKLWRVVFNGLLANMGDTRVSYFKVKGEVYFK